MIQGFEDITDRLTEYELNVLLPIFKRCLETKRGKDQAVTNKQMVEGLKSFGFKVSDPRVRKIIHHIRVNGMVQGLVATSNGYYIADSRTDLERYIESLRERERDIRQVRHSMEQQLTTY